MEALSLIRDFVGNDAFLIILGSMCAFLLLYGDKREARAKKEVLLEVDERQKNLEIKVRAHFDNQLQHHKELTSKDLDSLHRSMTQSFINLEKLVGSLRDDIKSVKR